jgi:hypothetical protein
MKIEVQRFAKTIWLYHKENIIRSISFQYCPRWEKPIYSISTNGARKGVKEDTCYDLNIRFWRFIFSYTNWNYNNHLKGKFNPPRCR